MPGTVPVDTHTPGIADKFLMHETTINPMVGRTQGEPIHTYGTVGGMEKTTVYLTTAQKRAHGLG
jgi:hypothetical protein